MSDEDEFWTEERRKRLREKLEPELEEVRYQHLRFRALSGTLDELEPKPAPRRKLSRIKVFVIWLALVALACLAIGSLRLLLGF